MTYQYKHAQKKTNKFVLPIHLLATVSTYCVADLWLIKAVCTSNALASFARGIGSVFAVYVAFVSLYALVVLIHQDRKRTYAKRLLKRL